MRSSAKQNYLNAHKTLFSVKRNSLLVNLQLKSSLLQRKLIVFEKHLWSRNEIKESLEILLNSIDLDWRSNIIYIVIKLRAEKL